MEIKFILLYGDRLIKIKSYQIINNKVNNINITDEIKNNDLLNDVEKEHYIMFFHSKVIPFLHNDPSFLREQTINEYVINPPKNYFLIFWHGYLCFNAKDDAKEDAIKHILITLKKYLAYTNYLTLIKEIHFMVVGYGYKDIVDFLNNS